MSIQLDDEMAENINTARLKGKSCVLATAAPDGFPSIGFRGSMMVFDSDHLAYWERSKRDGLANIQKNPRVTVMYRDNDTKVGWKFYGRTAIHEDGDLREQVWDRVVDVEKTPDPEKKGFAVIIEVDRVEMFNGTVPGVHHSPFSGSGRPGWLYTVKGPNKVSGSWRPAPLRWHTRHMEWRGAQ